MSIKDSQFDLLGTRTGDRITGLTFRNGLWENATFHLSQLSDAGSQVYNAVAFYARPSSFTPTLSAAAGAGSTNITLTDASLFRKGFGISIAGAGVSGGLYVGSVSSVTGNSLTVSPALSTSVSSGALVKNDNTAAIQSAINAANAAGGGIVFLPAGIYYLSSALNLAVRVSLIGAGGGRYEEHGVTSLEWSDITTGNGITLAGNTNFNRIQGMQLRGPGLSNTNTTGVFGNSGENFTLEDVLIYGWGIGANLYGMRGRNIGVYIDNCYGDCLLLRECAFWSSFESIYANSVTGRSIHLSADGGGCQFINFYDRVVDESGGPASIQIDKGNDISVKNCVVYSSRGIGLGGGYGVRLGDGTNTPTRVTCA